MTRTLHLCQRSSDPRANTTLPVATPGSLLRTAGSADSLTQLQNLKEASGNFSASWSYWGKRLLDLSCLIVGMPGVLLLMLGVAVCIKIVSPGPVFFKQERIGFRRKRFLCFKFRTMKVGADTQVHQQHLQQLFASNSPMTKLDRKGDLRLIPLGRFLRATGLDELPQLINVLRGEMSLVGPRPCTPYELGHYRPWQVARFDTLPGLTGLWQVSGKNKTTFTQMVNLDIAYTKSRTVWLDLKIMAATFGALASQVRDTYTRAHARQAPSTSARDSLSKT